MFESAELGHAVNAKTYDAEVEKLRAQLLAAQAEIFRKKAFPVVIVVSGVEAAGKGDTLRLLSEWMDARHIETSAFDDPDGAEREHPTMWRYWRAIPAAGTIGVFFRAWYREPIHARVFDGEKRAALEKRLDEITRFERMLTDEGALVLKYWLHLSKKAQRKKLEGAADRRTRWKVKHADWRNHERYSEFRDASEAVVRTTSTQHAPWVVVEATDDRYRRLTVMRVLLDAMRARLAEPKRAQVHAPPIVRAIDDRNVLRQLDLDKALDDREYDKRLGRAQAELGVLSRRAAKEKRAAVLVFEGPDASGKGGAIRRVTAALDPRHYRVTSVAAPTEEERAHPYLWRFWRAIPRDGSIAIFDRSWYGRLLVERVEGFCDEPAWMRAYGEINDFEAQMAAHGVAVLKFWLHVSKREQLRRFRSREDEAYKRFKITGEDWRNRKKWDAYEQAACDVFERTSTSEAPWTLVEANDKAFARVKVLETIVDRLRR